MRLGEDYIEKRNMIDFVVYMECHGMPWNAMECHGMPWNALWWIAKRDLEYVCICSLTNIVVLVVAFFAGSHPLTYLVPWLTDYLLRFVPSCFMLLLSSDSLSRTKSSHSKFHFQPVSSGEDPADFMPDNILDQGIVTKCARAGSTLQDTRRGTVRVVRVVLSHA